MSRVFHNHVLLQTFLSWMGWNGDRRSWQNSHQTIFPGLLAHIFVFQILKGKQLKSSSDICFYFWDKSNDMLDAQHKIFPLFEKSSSISSFRHQQDIFLSEMGGTKRDVPSFLWPDARLNKKRKMWECRKIA